MRRTTILLSLALAAVALSGCLGDQGSTGRLAPTSDQPSAPPDGWTRETTPIDWEGNLGTWACAPMGANTCGGTGLGDGDSWHPIEPGGRGQRIALTLTWEPSSPLTEELTLSVAPYTSCGDGCYSTSGGYAAVDGPSPLVLDLEDIALEGEQLGYIIYVDGATWIQEDPVFAGASHHQPFHVEGTLTTLVPPA